MRYYLIILSVLLTSCSKHWCELKYNLNDRLNDSSSTNYIERIDTSWLQMPADTQYIELPVNCPDQQIIYKDGKKETQLIFKDKILRVYQTTKADSIKILTLQRENSILKQQVKQTIVKVPITPKWVKRLLYIEVIILLLLIGYWQRKRIIPLVKKMLLRFIKL